MSRSTVTGQEEIRVLARIRGSLTYANVVATIALFFALSTGGAYAANEWTGRNIKDGTLTGADVMNQSLTGADIKNGRVASIDLADGAVTRAKIGAGAVAGAKIADGAVTGAKIADGSVGTADVANGSLTGADIADNSIASADVQALHGDNDIQDNTITTFDLADNSVDSAEVLDFGLTNEDVGVLYAQVNYDGTLASSSGGVTTLRLGLGRYEVDFGRDVSGAAFVATQGEATSSGLALGGYLGVTDRFNNVEAAYVTVRNENAVFVDRAFQIVVVF